MLQQNVSPQQVYPLNSSSDATTAPSRETQARREQSNAIPVNETQTSLQNHTLYSKTRASAQTTETQRYSPLTKLIMAMLSEMWIFNLLFIAGGTYLGTFVIPQGYTDNEIWNVTLYWKMAWILPLPYSLMCFFGLVLPFRTPKFLYDDSLPKRRVDNLYILTVTKVSAWSLLNPAWLESAGLFSSVESRCIIV
jgi:hypothetical protein